MRANEQFVSAFHSLSLQRQLEILGILTEIIASSSPELMKLIAEQIEAECKGGWREELTGEEQQRLGQSIREGEEGKTVSHEEVQQEVRSWLNSRTQ